LIIGYILLIIGYKASALAARLPVIKVCCGNKTLVKILREFPENFGTKV